MSNPFFRFKQFIVYHDLCAMKVGVDGVLLGAWCDVSSSKSILDVGTGSGLIALMLAQRNLLADICAIDIELSAIEQARINFTNSLWHNRFELIHTSFQELDSSMFNSFDMIVSNPPYFNNSLKSTNKTRTTARHTDALPHADLIDSAKLFLKEQGMLSLILPVKEGLDFVDSALQQGFYCSRLAYVSPKVNFPAKRLLIELSLYYSECRITHLAVETESRHEYTPEFIALVKDFYLKL